MRRLVVDCSSGSETWEDLTAAEEAKRTADAEADVVHQEAVAERVANEKTLRDRLTARMGELRTARTAIANGNLFSGLSVNERKLIDALLEDDIGIGRLILRQLDDTD